MITVVCLAGLALPSENVPIMANQITPMEGFLQEQYKKKGIDLTVDL